MPHKCSSISTNGLADTDSKQGGEGGREERKAALIPVDGDIDSHAVRAELDQVPHEFSGLSTNGLADPVEVLQVQLVEGVLDHLGEGREGGKENIQVSKESFQ